MSRASRGVASRPIAPMMPGSTPSSVTSPRRRSVSSGSWREPSASAYAVSSTQPRDWPRRPSRAEPAPVASSGGEVEGQRCVAGELGGAAQLGQGQGQPPGEAVEEARRRRGRGGQVDGHHVRGPAARRSASPCDRPAEGRRPGARPRRRRRTVAATGLGGAGAGVLDERGRPCVRADSIASLRVSTSPRCRARESAAVSWWAAATRRWLARSLMRTRIASAALPCHGTLSAWDTRRCGEGPDVATLLAQLGDALAARGGVAVHRSHPFVGGRLPGQAACPNVSHTWTSGHSRTRAPATADAARRARSGR